ncbi:MAG: carboxymuconolactone decarboxylase family protein [Thermomicrobiales bacterium]
MSHRLPVSKSAPAAYRAVIALDAAVGNDLEAGLKDLIYLRASQINGCTYCVDSHSVGLQDGGTPIRKIFAVSAWHESKFFTPRERLALELTEAITRIADGGVSDDLWSRASVEFGDEGLGDLILVISAINVLNRIGVSTILAVPPLEREIVGI